MLPFPHLPGTPSLISFHLGKQYPSAHGWGDYKVMKSIPQIIDENHRHGFIIIPDTQGTGSPPSFCDPHQHGRFVAAPYMRFESIRFSSSLLEAETGIV